MREAQIERSQVKPSGRKENHSEPVKNDSLDGSEAKEAERRNAKVGVGGAQSTRRHEGQSAGNNSFPEERRERIVGGKGPQCRESAAVPAAAGRATAGVKDC